MFLDNYFAIGFFLEITHFLHVKSVLKAYYPIGTRSTKAMGDY